MVVDASDESGIRLHIFSGLENTAHSYTLTTRTSSEPEGPKGELYLKAEPDAGNVGVIEGYKPGAKFAKLLKRANSYEMEGGFVERKPPIQERMYQKGIALGQFAVVWTGFYAMKKAFPEQAPIWLGFLWGAAWCYALLDGVHRIGSNISVWQTKKVEEKEKRKKSLAHAFSHNGASED